MLLVSGGAYATHPDQWLLATWQWCMYWWSWQQEEGEWLADILITSTAMPQFNLQSQRWTLTYAVVKKSGTTMGNQNLVLSKERAQRCLESTGTTVPCSTSSNQRGFLGSRQKTENIYRILEDICVKAGRLPCQLLQYPLCQSWCTHRDSCTVIVLLDVEFCCLPDYVHELLLTLCG